MLFNSLEFAIFFPIMGFVAIGFEHCVANMYFIPTGIILENWAGIVPPGASVPGSLGWAGFLWKNLLPVTIGNILGGIGCVGLVYWFIFLRPRQQSEPQAAPESVAVEGTPALGGTGLRLR